MHNQFYRRRVVKLRLERPQIRMDAGFVLAVLLILGAIASLLMSDLNTLNGILQGKRAYSDPEAGEFLIQRSFLVWLGIFVVVAVLALVCAKSILTEVEVGFSQAEVEALDALAKKRAEIEAKKEEELERRNKERIDALSSQMRDLQTFVWPDGRRVHVGQTDRNLGSIHTRTTEIRVDSPQQYDEFIVVVHLLQGVAYWEIGSANYFVDDDGKVVKLLDDLQDDSVRAQLIQYDYVAGVGLESRTAADKPAFRNAAQILCARQFTTQSKTQKRQQRLVCRLGATLVTFWSQRRIERTANARW